METRLIMQIIASAMMIGLPIFFAFLPYIVKKLDDKEAHNK